MSPLGLFPDFFDTPGERKRTGMTRLGSPGVLSRSVFGFVCQKNPEMDGEPLSLQARVTIGNICVGLSPSSFQCPSPVMKDKKRRPDRSVYVCMHVCMCIGKSSRAPRRGVLCIYVIQEPRDGTARHTEDKARKKVWHCFMMAVSCMQRTICVTAKSRIES